MLLDFTISESDQRGRGSHMPSHVLDAIAESDPVPACVTLSALRKIKHVGKGSVANNSLGRGENKN
jgi:hypothetical protein